MLDFAEQLCNEIQKNKCQLNKDETTVDLVNTHWLLCFSSNP